MQAREAYKQNIWKQDLQIPQLWEEDPAWVLILAKVFRKECYLLHRYPSWNPNCFRDVSREKKNGTAVFNDKHSENILNTNYNGAYRGQNVKSGQKSDRSLS